MTRLSEFISDAIANNGWTHDVPHLDTQDHWYVFVYGKRRGKSTSYFTHDESNAEFVSIGWTKSAIYSILNIEDGKSEYQLSNPLGGERILGEVWKVPTERMLILDGDERNLLITKRMSIPVVIGARGVVDAFIYNAHPKYLLTGGIKVSSVKTFTYFGNDRFLELR